MSNTARRLIAYLFLAIAVATGAWMYWQNTLSNFWGYAPLLLYFSLYAGVFLLATYQKDGSVRKRNILSMASGLLLGVGYPGLIPFPLTLLVALVPALYLMRQLRAENAPKRVVLLHGYSIFVLYNLVTTYWVTNTGFYPGLLAVATNSLLMCVPWMFFYWSTRRLPGNAYLAFAAAWMSFEFLHFNWSLNWPWLALGNGFMQFPEVVQWYELTGVFGGTAWVLACNYLVYRVSLAHFRPDIAPASAPPTKWLTALVLLPIVASLARYFTYVAPPGETITVASIQPNFEPHFEKFGSSQGAQLDTFLRLSNTALAAGPVDYLLYPETSFSNIDEGRAPDSEALSIIRGNLQKGGAKYLVTGVEAYKIFEPGEPLTDAVRYFNRGKNGKLAYEALNGAVQVDLSGQSDAFQTYRKGLFVPGAEQFPFRKILFFMEPLVNSLGGTVAGRGTQAERTSFTSELADVAPVICYESVFGEYFTDYIRAGAQAIFVMTNDGWWGKTAGYRQHLWLSSLRAIETRRDIVRSANMGACAFIDQRGKIKAKTEYAQEGYLRGEMQLNDAITPYVRAGDILARIAVLIFTLAFLANVVRSLSPAAYVKNAE